MDNVTIHFQYKLLRADFDNKKLSFATSSEPGQPVRTVDADLTIGCDGAYSKVREQMMRVVR